MRKCIIILGMHRSGTSCLAGLLEEAGLFLGDVSMKNPYNLKGNKEKLDIMQLHDDLLNSNGGAWDNPPHKVKWYKRHKGWRDKIIKSFSGVNLWGFKDPRTLLTLDGWLEALPNVSFVGTFRNPIMVSQSLMHRNNFPIQKSFEIWYHYNTKLIEYHELYRFPIISFDIDGIEYIEKIKSILKFFPLPYKNSFDFFDQSLRHFTFDETVTTSIPDKIINLYKTLTDISL